MRNDDKDKKDGKDEWEKTNDSIPLLQRNHGVHECTACHEFPRRLVGGDTEGQVFKAIWHHGSIKSYTDC